MTFLYIPSLYSSLRPTLSSFRALPCCHRCSFLTTKITKTTFLSRAILLPPWHHHHHHQQHFRSINHISASADISASTSASPSSLSTLSSTSKVSEENENDTSMFATDMTFTSLGLSQSISDQLAQCGLHTPTKAQAAVIPVLLHGLKMQSSYADAMYQYYKPTSTDDNIDSEQQQQLKEPKRDESDVDDVLMFGAETGSGKTLAYLAPFIQTTMETEIPLKAIILLPTRELCAQVSSFLTMYFSSSSENTKHIILSGGELSDNYSLKNVRIVLATPTALLQYLRLSEKPSSMADKMIVIDEADMLLQGSFLKDLELVLDHPSMKPFATRKNGNLRKQNGNRLIFVGATFPHWIGTKVKSIITWMKRRYPNIHAIQTQDVHKRNMKLQSSWYYIPNEIERIDKLRSILLLNHRNEEDDNDEKIMVFCNKADTAQRISEILKHSQPILDKYGGITQLHKLVHNKERKQHLDLFLNNQCRILICTDLASRGLHLGHVSRVIEFDFASNVVAYLHRIGRTARAGASGKTDHFYDDVSKPLAEAIRTKAETEATVVESIFSRNRSFRRKLKKLRQQQQQKEEEEEEEGNWKNENVPVSLENVEIDEMDEQERQRWNQ